MIFLTGKNKKLNKKSTVQITQEKVEKKWITERFV
jgi:hypothetical protein